MPRTPILAQIVAILDASPVAHEWLPESYTYCNLARQVYGTDEPTPAQLSAVRRAAAKLVAGGRAERRRGDRRFDPNRTHVRRRRNGEFVYANPAGTEVRRPLTEAERQTRDKLRAAERARLAAGGSAWPDGS